jgi:hypothetical protein
MAKLPWFKFYPADWMIDQDLRRCSPAARGIWADMLCFMFQCETRGVLASGGIPWTIDEIVSAVGGNADVTRRCIDELVAKRVCRLSESGAYSSKRMMEDHEIRENTRKRVQKHRSGSGNAPCNVDVTQHVTQDVTPKKQVEVRSQKSDLLSTHTHTGSEAQPEEAGPEPEKQPESPPEHDEPPPPAAAYAHHPAWPEVQSHCQTIGLPEWRARMWWDEMEAVGWMRKGQLIRSWKPLLNTVRTWWESDGSPMNPPARRTSTAQGGAPQQANGKSDWSDHKKLELLEAEIKKVKGRGTESALGTRYSPKDSELLKELIAKRTEIKNKLLA